MHVKKYIFTVLVSFLCLTINAQSSKWQDVHTVKKGETIFGISRQYGITIDELINANPQMHQPDYELKKGETINIPYANVKTQSKAPTTTSSPTNAGNAIEVGVMLPLHNLDGDGRRMIEYYRGLLLGIEKLKNDGVNINVHAWNVPQDADIRTTLVEHAASKLNIVFGPLYTKQVKDLGDYCRSHGTTMVIPFSITSDEVDRNPSIYQVYESNEQMTDASIKHFLERFVDYHPVFIDCNDGSSNKGSFTFGLRKQLETRGIQYNITNLNSSLESFAKSFSLGRRNIVILNTGRSPELTKVMKKLDELKSSNRNVQISIYGYTDWLMYQKYNDNQNYFCKYDTYIPSNFYFNDMTWSTQQLVKKYREKFGTDMQNALPRFAVTGYDQALFFIGGIKKYGTAFNGNRNQTYEHLLQSTYNFRKNPNGGYQNHGFMYIHFKTDGTMESLSY